MAQAQEQVPVLIVGAGDAGLSLALLLLQQGIHPLLVERRDDISIYPRARNLNFRSLEIFRGLGLAAEVRAAGAHISRTIFKETLAARDERIEDPTAGLIERMDVLSPDPFGWYCPQSRLEPLLLAATRARGGDVRYGVELISFTQDDTSVIATLKEHASEREYVVRAEYLAACDGAHSHIRAALGVATQGYGPLPEHAIFVYFRAPWRQLIAGHEADAFVIKNAEADGIFLVAGAELGMFLITYRPAPGAPPEEYTAERCQDLLRKAIGDPDLPTEIVDIARWQPAQSVAERFQVGRVFLVGDAAHTMPAYKGLGANTAIQSAQNLGWKLAAILHGLASRELLATYQAERHPVGWFAAEQSLTGPATAWLPKGVASKMLSKREDLPLFYPIVGYRYRSAAVLDDGDAPTSSDAASDAGQGGQDGITLLAGQELTGLPGTRVPHVWLQRRSGERISTLDLLDGRFVLLAGCDGASWRQAAEGAAATFGIALAVCCIGPARPGGSSASDADPSDLVDLDGGWWARMGVTPNGAVLVRPDGFVGWRAHALTGDPRPQLERALSRILGRATASSSQQRSRMMRRAGR